MNQLIQDLSMAPPPAPEQVLFFYFVAVPVMITFSYFIGHAVISTVKDGNK